MEQLLDVIGDVYEASINPGHWDKVLEKICIATGSRSGCLAYEDHTTKTRAWLARYGLPRSAALAFRFGLARYDPIYAMQEKEPVGVARQVVNVADLADEHPLYVKLMAKPYNIGLLAAIKIHHDDTWHAGIGLHRGFDSEPFSPESLEFLQALYPHLHRALRIHREMLRLSHEKQTLAATLANLALGILVVRPDRQVLYSNPVAMAIMNGHGGLAIHNGQLRGHDRDDQRHLEQALERFAATDPQDVDTRQVAIGFCHPDRDLPLTAMLTNINDVPEHLQGIDTPGAVAIYLSDPDAGVALSPEALKEFYAMTDAEARVALSLANGLSLQETAAQQGVSYETVRSHLKAIARKLGVSKQQEVLRVLLGGTARTGAG